MQSRLSAPHDRYFSTRILTGGLVIAATGLSLIGMLILAWRMGAADTAASPIGLPTVSVILAAVVVLGLVLGAAILLEAISLLPLLRRTALSKTPEPESEAAPCLRHPIRLTVVISAHNEESTLPATLAALRSQSHVPDRVFVIADSCTDQTAEVARRAGGTVIEVRHNTGRKAGALNQGFTRLLPDTDEHDLMLVMDADTRLSPDFLRRALQVLDADPGVSAVGGVFIGDDRRGMLAQLQRNEFARYARQLASRRGRVFVLTGTATVFRARALAAV